MKISRILWISLMAVSSTLLIACNPARNEHEAKETTKLTVCVIPTSNGYDYAQQGYEIESTLEKSLSKSKNSQLAKFPLSKFKGSGYQGIYDKKYCRKILKYCKVDYIIMSRLRGGYFLSNEEFDPWGYEIKILNTKTMEQKISIGQKDFETFEEIQSHIEQNINQLVEDMTK